MGETVCVRVAVAHCVGVVVGVTVSVALTVLVCEPEKVFVKVGLALELTEDVTQAEGEAVPVEVAQPV